MTATAKELTLDAPAIDIPDVTLRARDGVPFLVRTAQRFAGVSLSVAAVTLMIFPFGAGSTTEILCKMMVAIVLGFAGAALYQAGSPVPTPELELDIIRREVRLVRWTGKSRTVARRVKFSDLSRAEFGDRSVRIWDGQDTMLAELTLSETGARRSLKSALMDEGIRV